MKKTIFFFAMLMTFMASANAQTKDNVARECVLFELFTGVRCPYCPAAANAVAQLLEEGKPIAPVAYHTSAFSTPPYYNNETQARANYYGITGYPTLKADGVLSYVGGGSASETNYGTYLNRYNQRINQTSPFSIDLTCEPGDDGIWTVHCTVNQVGECDAANPKVMIALTQSNIDVAWMGMQGLHHVCRDMIPNQMGTAFVGPSMTINETFEMNWPKDDCYLTAWVQNYSGTKEVYQAVRLSLSLDLDYDMVLKEVKSYTPSVCSGMINPTVTVANGGNETVTSFQVAVLNNGTEIHREAWTGSMEPGSIVDFQMSDFEVGELSQLTFEVVEPNGNPEGYAGDNKMNIELGEPVVIDGYLKIQVKTDAYPEETTIQVVEIATDEVVLEYQFDQSSHVYTYETGVMNAGCYRIRVLDSASNGFDGIIRVSDASGNVIFKVDNKVTFTNEIRYEFNCDGTWSVGEDQQSLVTLYPNPSNGCFRLGLGEGDWQVVVYDLTGRVVHEEYGFSQGDVQLNCGKGVYFLKATDGHREVLRKVMVY